MENKQAILSFYDDKLTPLGDYVYVNVYPSKGDYVVLDDHLYMILGKLFKEPKQEGINKILVKNIPLPQNIPMLDGNASPRWVPTGDAINSVGGNLIYE